MKGPEEFTLTKDDRISELSRRRPHVVFTDVQAVRAEAINVVSLDGLLGAHGDVSYVTGVKASTKAIASLLYNSDMHRSGWILEQLEVWLAHVVSRSPNCTCTIDYSGYDSDYEIEYCPWYADKKNQRLWYLGYYGLTEEELTAREREAARQKAEAEHLRMAQAKAERRERLLELAEEFGVDPKYLP